MWATRVAKSYLPDPLVMYLQFADHYLRGEPEIRLIKLLLSDRGNAIDVGANIGVYTYFMSRHARQVFSI